MILKITKLVSFALIFVSAITLVRAQDNIYDICRNGSIEQVKSIYAKNQNIINEENDNGDLPLTLACYHGNYDVAKFLVNKVEDINANSDRGTPLMAAVFKKELSIVELLLKNNANPNIKDINGSTAMHYATMFKNYEIIKLLVDADSDFTIKDNNGKSALDFAKAYKDNKLNSILNLKQ